MEKMLIVCTTDSMIWNFLVPHIKDLEKKHINVECACSRTGFYYDELVNKFGLKLHEINFGRNPFKAQNVKAFFELSKLIKANHYDCIYGHEPVGGAMARMAGKVNGKYVLYAAHGFHFFKHAPLKHWLLYYTFEYVLSFFTNAIITICNEDYENACKLHAEHTYLIPGIGVDFSRYRKNNILTRRRVREKYNISDNDFLLITVGEMSKRKNHIVILEAMKRLKNPNLKLFICGEGELETFLKEKVIEYGLKEQVIFLGFRKDIPNILPAADLFIFPSLWEGLGLAGIEAMYIGLPVIGSNRQGIKDYVIDGITGYLFEPRDTEKLANKITILMEDSALKEKMSENGKTLVLKYNIENSIDALNSIYRKENII